MHKIDEGLLAQSQDQLTYLMESFSQFGRLENGGLCRLAASKEDGLARDFLCAWLDEKGFEILIDAVGNIFGLLTLNENQSGKDFFCGSHLDSQPNGGHFDGVLGVAAACASGLYLRDAVQQRLFAPAFDRFVIACWTGEEGARFRPAMLGSRTFTGELSADETLKTVDDADISLHQALKDISYAGSDMAPRPAHYFELHIEQGPTLDAANIPIGLVDRCWGALKLNIEIKGRPDHTGPAPMHSRKDALLAAAHLIKRVNDIANLSYAPIHSSVGRLDISPNSPNTVADHVNVWVELRAGTEAKIVQARHQLDADIEQVERETGCTIAITNQDRRNVVIFDEPSRLEIAATLEESGIPYLTLPTIAGHDAIALQSLCPSTLMFVPSENGVSHTPDEFTAPEELKLGMHAMIGALTKLMSK